MQTAQMRLAWAIGSGGLLAALEATASFTDDTPTVESGSLMITLHTHSLDDLAAFALGQV